MSETNIMTTGYTDGSTLLFFFLLLVLLFGRTGYTFGAEVGAEAYYGGSSWIFILLIILLFSGRRWF